MHRWEPLFNMGAASASACCGSMVLLAITPSHIDAFPGLSTGAVPRNCVGVANGHMCIFVRGCVWVVRLYVGGWGANQRNFNLMRRAEACFRPGFGPIQTPKAMPAAVRKTEKPLARSGRPPPKQTPGSPQSHHQHHHHHPHRVKSKGRSLLKLVTRLGGSSPRGR